MTAAPPWPTRASLATTWVVAAVGLGALLAVAQTTESRLDDHDPAYQRPGFLDLGELPEPAPQITSDFPVPGRRALVFFERPGRLERLCGALAGNDLPDRADVAVVVAGRPPKCEADVTLVSDPRGRLAHEFGLHEPRDGGPSVGYAVVDSEGKTRYRTLDPAAAGQLDEVSTILTATP